MLRWVRAALAALAVLGSHSLPLRGQAAPSAPSPVRDWPVVAAAYDSIVRAQPGNGQAWYRLGMARLHLDQDAAAAAALSRAADLHYSESSSLYNLSCALAKSGNREGALQALQRLVGLGFFQAGQLENDPDLRSVRDDARFRHLVDVARGNDPPRADMPAPSPDGSHLAFVVFRGGVPAVYVSRADGSGARQVSRRGVFAWTPNWSPDGGRLIYSLGPEGNRHLVVQSLEGSREVELTSGPGNDHYPSWSPDGKRVVFNSDRGGRRQVYLVAAEGGVPQALTSSEGNSDYPSWSADGKQILFESNRVTTYGIYLMDADGAHQRRIAWGSAPRFAPDGRHVVYHDSEDGTFHLFEMAADGTGSRQLTSGAASDRVPDYLPGQESVVFVSDRGGHDEIYAIPRDGTSVRQLTTTTMTAP